MEPIYGPFWPDPNISVGAVAFDPYLWILKRRAVHDVSGGPEWGIIELGDVRGFRSRTLLEGQFLDVPDDARPGFWAVRLGPTDYLEQCLSEHRERLPPGSPHAHYVIADGWSRVIDVVAKSLSCRAVSGPVVATLSALLESGPAEDFLR